MAYQRKTTDVYGLFVNYGYGYGYEHELDEYSMKDARIRQKEYRDNCPQYQTKIVKRREKINTES